MEDNTSQELNKPLIQPALYEEDGDVDNHATMWSSARSILDESTQPTAVANPSGVGPRDEADVATGVKRSSRIDSSLTGFVLAVILFFNAAGGPFGVEPSLKAAGNLYTIIGFAAMPFLWALPEAVMTYELSSLYPCASAGVRWTEEAFGESWGLLVGYLGWISGVTNNASYPVLFLSYVHTQFFPHISDTDSNAFLHYGILVGITVVLVCVNYRGLHVVGKASVLIFFVSMAPFVLMVIIGTPKVDPSKWLQTPTGEVKVFDDDSLNQKGWFPEATFAGIAFRPFINNLYWNFNGFDQGGNYSTTVTQKTLRTGIGGSLLLVSSAYLLPILIATGATDIEQSEWKEGSFATAGTEIGGRWLGNWIVVSSGISLLAQFFCAMSSDSMQIQGMADRGQLPSFFRHQSQHDTPTYAILLGLLVILVLLPLPFGIIIELSNFSFCLSVIVEFLAFAQLRIRKGDCTQLRKALYVILLVAPMLFNIAVLLLASYATYIFGACMTVFGILLINAKRLNLAFCSICGWGVDRDGGCDSCCLC